MVELKVTSTSLLVPVEYPGKLVMKPEGVIALGIAIQETGHDWANDANGKIIISPSITIDLADIDGRAGRDVILYSSFSLCE
jgi:hypothetical protein